MKNLIMILLLTATTSALAQRGRNMGRGLEEMQETVRFIRLAESKKELSFSDETLLKANEIADAFETARIKIKQQERRLNFQMRRAQRTGQVNGASMELVDQLIGLRKKEMDLQVKMWADLKAALTPDEAVQYYAFYERFSKDVRRRIQKLQRDRRQGNQNEGNQE